MKKSIQSLMEAHNVEVRSKGKFRNWRGWHKIVPVFFFFVGIFNRRMKRDFYGRFWNVLSNVIYLPDKRLKAYQENPGAFEKIIRHELIHVVDDAKSPVLFKLKYVISKDFRAYSEFRGYTQDMMYEFEKTGYISVETIYSIARIFASDMYFRMHLSAEPILQEIKNGILNERVIGFEEEPLNTIIKDAMEKEAQWVNLH